MSVLAGTLVCLVLICAWFAWAWFFPHKRCFACRKRGKRGAGSTRFGYSRCRRCKDSPGEQVRWTAQLISKATGRPVRGS